MCIALDTFKKSILQVDNQNFQKFRWQMLMQYIEFLKNISV